MFSSCHYVCGETEHVLKQVVAQQLNIKLSSAFQHDIFSFSLLFFHSFHMSSIPCITAAYSV